MLTATLVISEINYDPHAVASSLGEVAEEAKDFEFIELFNASSEPINLAGFRLARIPVEDIEQGVNFTFPNLTLAVNERAVVVRDVSAFQSRYGSLSVIGEWTGGSLSNQGETITLFNTADEIAHQVTYGSNSDWPFLAEGLGASLEIIDVTADPDDPENWRSSVELGGSPGRAPTRERSPTVLINEVLAHTDEPQVDSVELRNLTNEVIEIGGWHLTDRISNPTMFTIPQGTTIPPHGYIVFDEGQFNPGGGVLPEDFAISEFGEDLYLFSPNVGRPIRIEDMVVLGHTANGVSVGNVLDVRDERELLPLASPTLGQPNDVHKVSEVVISEIQFHPPDDDVFKEFIELQNTTPLPLDLSNWELSGAVDLTIQDGMTIDEFGNLVLVPFDPEDHERVAAFRSYYQVDTSVRLVGPWSSNGAGEPDKLSNSNESIELRKPLIESNKTYSARSEYVHYYDSAPWPALADGEGASISRASVDNYGNVPESWIAAMPTPGVPSPRPNPKPSHNTDLPEDVNADGVVAPFDALLIINELNAAGSTSLPLRSPSFDLFMDVNGDNVIAPIDALMVINYLNAPPADGSVISYEPAPPASESTAEVAAAIDVYFLKKDDHGHSSLTDSQPHANSMKSIVQSEHPF